MKFPDETLTDAAQTESVDQSRHARNLSCAVDSLEKTNLRDVCPNNSREKKR
jgi:hypothetical protein